MTGADIRGSCEDCGKVFRVPSAERTYDCKACGGCVIPDGYEEEEEEFEEQQVAVSNERLSQRGKNRTRDRGGARGLWIVLTVVIVAGLAGLGLYESGVLASETGPPKDLDEYAAALVEDWEAGDIAALVELYHPDGRRQFQTTLERAAQTNGWEQGFAPVQKNAAELIEGTQDAPVRGAVGLGFGEGTLTLNLQFDAGRERWYVTGNHLTPPRVAARVTEFREAWAQSDPAALTPLFHPKSAEKMAALVERQAKKAGWSSDFPDLDQGDVRGEEAARAAPSTLLGPLKLESVFAAAGGELVVRWRYAPEDYAWYVTGFGFPE